ncbi:MAG TPA: cytochrome c oxidase assembly protein [Acetobacteraceae bacterium]|nr:cytochrome c oxidase assembly protein [Acetobacteraceae bacterium]
MSAWHLDACCVAAVVAAPFLYALGLVRLWRRAGVGRGATPLHAFLFTLGWLAVAASVLSPIHTLGTQVFVVHMTEHELLMIVAAPLLVLARPVPVLLWGLPAGWRRGLRRFTQGGPRRLWRWLSAPLNATMLHAAALWAWHLPGPFQAALAHEGMHAAQHICFFATGVLFWWSVLSAHARRASPVGAALALFVTMAHTSLLGALLALSKGVWYPAESDPFAICGLTRIEDQQLAGLVMWVPSGVAYLAAALWLIGRRLVVAERGYGPARA